MLTFTGAGFVIGVPGRDLTDTDLRTIAERERETRLLIPIEHDEAGKPIEKTITTRTIKSALIASGAYAAVEQPAAKVEAKTTEAKPKDDIKEK